MITSSAVEQAQGTNQVTLSIMHQRSALVAGKHAFEIALLLFFLTSKPALLFGLA
jgi:hypothetical protein